MHRLILITILVLSSALPAQQCAPQWDLSSITGASKLGKAMADLGEIGPGLRVLAVGDPLQDKVHLFDACTGAHLQTIGGLPGTEFGDALAKGPDLTGDQRPELLVGAPGWDAGGQNRGAVYIFTGGSTGTAWSHVPGTSINAPSPQLIGGSANDKFGISVAAVRDDANEKSFVVGAPGVSGGAGQVKVFVPSGLSFASILTATGLGSDELGFAVAGGGDFDGDLVPDFAAGAPGANGSIGEVRIWSGGATHALLLVSVVGSQSGNRYGHAIAFGGDTDCDGCGDLIVGSPGYDGGKGRGVVVFGDGPGCGSPSLPFVRDGTKVGASLGRQVSGGRDLTGDRLPDPVLAEGNVLSNVALEAHILEASVDSILPDWGTAGQFNVGACFAHLTVIPISIIDPTMQQPAPPAKLVGSEYTDTGSPGICGPAGGASTDIGLLNPGGASLTITAQPVSQTRCTGLPCTFSVTANWSGALGYQWRHDGASIPGATAASYTIAAVTTTDAGVYSVVITMSGALGSGCQFVLSQDATLTVSGLAASIIQGPSNLEACAGTTAVFSVQASYTPDVAFQWQKDGTDISGANEVNYVIPAVQPSDAGSYRLVITQTACGLQGPTALISQPAVLTVFNGLTLVMSQPGGSGSLLVRNRCGNVGFNWFSAFSFDPINQTSNPSGWWGNLNIGFNELLSEYLFGTPPFVGVFGPSGSSDFFVPYGSLPPGLPIAGVTLEYFGVPSRWSGVAQIVIQ